jgi:hypothetical protein
MLIQRDRRQREQENTHDNFRRRLNKYGISRAKFEELYDKQLGRCAICLLPLSETRIHVDHDHKTRKIRGLLCNTCNPGLGYFRDDPAMLERAAAYIRENAPRRRLRKEVTSSASTSTPLPIGRQQVT